MQFGATTVVLTTGDPKDAKLSWSGLRSGDSRLQSRRGREQHVTVPRLRSRTSIFGRRAVNRPYRSVGLVIAALPLSSFSRLTLLTAGPLMIIPLENGCVSVAVCAALTLVTLPNGTNWAAEFIARCELAGRLAPLFLLSFRLPSYLAMRVANTTEDPQ
ncbi:hypothetical protein CIT25_29495 [Mesorhizobium mediterraneum]|uniref:Uncharacterized protein n=1 Tax=Mesorhizobium mediterraneum TaxID=43617 RepID=A0AB36R1J4_9HYPH|nr:hypothetical protein CIT25_29495 [Mesorhizobium mediterraneum]